VVYGSSLEVKLLPPTAAPLAVRDPSSNTWRDFTRCLAAFVTPDDPSSRNSSQSLHTANEGGRPDASVTETEAEVEQQVAAVYEMLRGRVRYVRSGEAFSDDPTTVLQRVRLPRETLKYNLANCVDGVILFASVLTAAGIETAFVLLGGHALVAWRANGLSSGTEWQYLDTTGLERESFKDARRRAQQLGESLESQYRPQTDCGWALPRLWPLARARELGITPIQSWLDPAGYVAPEERPFWRVLGEAAVVWLLKALGSWRLSEEVLRKKHWEARAWCSRQHPAGDGPGVRLAVLRDASVDGGACDRHGLLRPGPRAQRRVLAIVLWQSVRVLAPTVPPTR